MWRRINALFDVIDSETAADRDGDVTLGELKKFFKKTPELQAYFDEDFLPTLVRLSNFMFYWHHLLVFWCTWVFNVDDAFSLSFHCVGRCVKRCSVFESRPRCFEGWMAGFWQQMNRGLISVFTTLCLSVCLSSGIVWEPQRRLCCYSRRMVRPLRRGGTQRRGVQGRRRDRQPESGGRSDFLRAASRLAAGCQGALSSPCISLPLHIHVRLSLLFHTH